MQPLRIAVVGTGYVGLVSGTCFARLGHSVVCMDRDEARISPLRDGEVPIYEPGLREDVLSAVQAGRLAFTTDLGEAVKDADLIFIAVGTPTGLGGEPDLSAVFAVSHAIGTSDATGVVVVKSTVPVGTGDEVEAIIKAERPGREPLPVVSNPEFLREGNAIADFMAPDRILIGSDKASAAEVVALAYRPLAEAENKLIFTGRRAAELIKSAANAFLAMKVSFVNELADLCEKTGVDVEEVADGIGGDQRIGRAFLNAGPGFGGSCFPKDARAMIHLASNVGTRLRLIESTIEANEARKRSLAMRVVEGLGGSVSGRRVAVLGLTFKPDTDDTREGAPIAIIRELMLAGANVSVFDPKGMDNARSDVNGADFADDALSCVEGAEATVIVTEWDEFRRLDLVRLSERMAGTHLFDFRNIFDAKTVRAAGLLYYGVGRTAV